MTGIFTEADRLSAPRCPVAELGPRGPSPKPLETGPVSEDLLLRQEQMDVCCVSLTQQLKCDLSGRLAALVALHRRYETASEGKIMKLAERKGWRRLCGWKKASKSRGEIFHKPGQRLEAETRMRESPERWR